MFLTSEKLINFSLIYSEYLHPELTLCMRKNAINETDTTNHHGRNRKRGATILNECLEHECVIVETDKTDIYQNLLHV